MQNQLHPDAGIELQFQAPENQHGLVTRLQKSAERMTQRVSAHPEVESAWLAAMAFMETTAAHGVTRSINHTTPESEKESIFTHYSDEMRHGQLLTQMKPTLVQSERGRELEKKMCRATRNFTYGFFVHPMVQKISEQSTYAGYVHAALTIEQIPFQMYSNYYLKAKGELKATLTQILKDEYQHLKHGKRLYQQLEQNLQFPIDALQTLEMEMCLDLVNQLNGHMDQYLSSST